LNCPKLKKQKVSEEMIRHIVKTDEKGRYELVDGPPLYIRCVQGHSTKTVKDEDILDPITTGFNYGTVLHGTYYEAWNLIKDSGLNRMTRNNIHFTIGAKNDSHVISGMRNDCQVFIEINFVQAFHNDVKFFISKNKVVLTPGNNGVLHQKYFKKVEDHKGNILFSQNYEYVIWTNDGDISLINLRSESDVINYKIIDGTSAVEFFNNSIDDMCSKSIFKSPTVIAVDLNNESAYTKFVMSNYTELKHKSIFTEFIPVNNDIITKKQYGDTFSAKNLKKINIESNNNNNLKEGKSIQQTIVKSYSPVFQLTKSYLKDKTTVKNYILIFLNFDKEQEDILYSIDFILIKQSIDNTVINRFELENKTIKANITNFLDILKTFLKKEEVIDKCLILCAIRTDIDYLKEKMKKSLLKIPNLFISNIILLKESDFNYLEPEETKQAAEIFITQYVNDDETIDKLKLL
jgi:2'-phosphotransferase